MAKAKITLKNAMVYDYMKRKIRSTKTTSVKAVYRDNKAEIAEQFNIGNYQGFNYHVRKCLDWEARTNSKVEVIRMDNKEVSARG